MQTLESAQENETYKILWDFEITNRSLNPGRKTKPSFNFQEAKNLLYSGFCYSSKIVQQTGFFSPGQATSLGEGKLNLN